ncbi:MAG: serine/threonine protein kinase [Bryobacterales bacterium]|nr:serine/threonine protein kinase [Bryobacterales bacterium]
MSEWETITGLLADATERPAGERRGWLRESGHAEAVIEKALALLAAWEADPDYLEIDLPLPETVGPWRLGRELGAGGMGRVYEAFHSDPAMERRVAVKVIGGRRFAPELIALFLRERAILARLEHPHIARLYDTGTTGRGTPYFAMEYVDGPPLDRYMEQRNPGERERVELLRRVCGAIAFAHRNLIVHGDIKPGNILVTGEGEPRLLDFGIGRILSDGERGAEAILTPSHASPEQMEGREVTTASDVYQLGLLLRAFLPAKNRELAMVAEKCLRADPAGRYASAEALENELQAWLEHRPLAAIAPSMGYVGKKLVRRHPWGAALAGAVLIGTATTAWQTQRANESRERTLRQFEETRKFSRAMLRTIAALPVTARLPIVRSTAELLNNFDHTQEQDPVLLLELANAWRALGAVQGLPTTANLGLFEESGESYDKAIALAKRARAENERDSLLALCAYYAEAARVQTMRNEGEKAAVLASKLAAAAQDLEKYGPSNDLATAFSEIAFFLSRTDRHGAMEAYRKAVNQFDKAPVADPGQKAYALKRWGALLLAENKFEEGEAKYKAALAIERQSKVKPFDVSYTLSDLGLVARQQRRFAESLGYYEEALAIREAARQADPGDTRAVMALASTLIYMAWVKADAGNLDEAVALARRSLPYAIQSAAPPRNSRYSRLKLAWGRLYLAMFLRRQDAKGNAMEIQALTETVGTALRNDPDADIAAELKALTGTTR